MKKILPVLTVMLSLSLSAYNTASAQDPEKLHILWTSDNKETVMNMLTMYAGNAKKQGWWQEVNIIIWGASARLASSDEEIQAQIKELTKLGITVEACSDRYGVSDKLKSMGVNVRYMGKPLTDYLKSVEKILSL